METDPHVLGVAREAVKTFGAQAAIAMNQRAEDHTKAGEHDGAKFWRRVAAAVTEILWPTKS